MSYQTFGLMLAHAGNNVEELAKLKRALKTLRSKAKSKEEARRIADQMHALRYVEIKYSKCDLAN